ncbi:TetR/AcrR family transcriptional regulator [Propionicimonas paludicola]|uniref:TetR/AcrR family transcriptional regulator n=1 Tax=Propionicimonas paludicola TaxID=185243 RepID=UPI001B80B9F6|nr:TetR/AcrR family transcriptional regulator [Propionicimonas paludicola]
MLSDTTGPLQALRADAASSIGRILAAAREALRRPGSTTLNLIAKEAGVGIATLYRHFPNREKLAEAVMERVFVEEVRPLLTEFCASDASRDDLLSVAERLVDLLERERGVVESIGNIASVTSEFLARDEELRDTIARAQAAGNLRPDLDPDDVPALLAMVTAVPGLLDTDQGTRRRYLSLLLDGLNPTRAQELPGRRAVEARR